MTHRALHHTLGTFRARPRPRRSRCSRGSGRTRAPTIATFPRWSGSRGCSAVPRSRSRCSRCWRTRASTPPRTAPPARPGRDVSRRVRHAARWTIDPISRCCRPGPRSRKRWCGSASAPTTVTAPDVARGAAGAWWSAVARRLVDPRATVESTGRGDDPRLRRAGRAAERRRPIRAMRRWCSRPRSTADVGHRRCRRSGTFRDELRLEGDEKFDVRLVAGAVPGHARAAVRGPAASGMPLQEAILRMTPDRTTASADADEDGFTAESLDGRTWRRRRDRDRPAGGAARAAAARPRPRSRRPSRADAGQLHATGRDEFVYPEWDSDRRPLPRRLVPAAAAPATNRCAPTGRTGERSPAHGHLLPGLVAQLERVRPAGRDLVLRMPYGDDLDLDACIDAMVDLRAGIAAERTASTRASRNAGVTSRSRSAST